MIQETELGANMENTLKLFNIFILLFLLLGIHGFSFSTEEDKKALKIFEDIDYG